MKVHKTVSALMLVGLMLVSFSSFAQSKTLQTESDGFQWYELEQNGKYGAQSMRGTTFIPLSRGYTLIFYNQTGGGWFSVEKNGSGGVCDITGREIVVPGKYDEASYRKSDDDGYEYCYVKLNGKEGVCDMNGREIVPLKFQLIIYSRGYFYASLNNNKTGLYDKTGYEVIAPKYDVILYIEEKRYFSVYLDNKVGACDMSGREIIAPTKYKSLDYQNGVFKYRNSPNEKWVSTGISLPKDNGTTTTATNTITLTPAPTPTPTPTPSPTPTPQPQPQPEPVRQPQPFQVWQPCQYCGGTGQCQTCLGTGHTLVYPCQDRCWNCGGTGKCTHCAGQGGRNVIEYH